MRGEPGDVVVPQPFIAEKYSSLLGVDKDQMQNGRLYTVIDQRMGRPDKFGGLDHDGIDCSGLSFGLEQ